MKEDKLVIFTLINYIGVSFALAFTVLKFYGVIDWEWWIVFLPLWCPVALFIIILSIVSFCKKKSKKKRRNKRGKHFNDK